MEVIVEPAMNGAAGHASHFRGMRHVVFVMLPPRAFVSYDLLRRRVHVVVSSAAARDRAFWNTLLLPITVGVLGTTVGVVPLHCACLDGDGGGFLIAGVSGAGKSTLATALARRGFGLISDDWTYLSMKQSVLAGYGLCSPVKLLPDAARFFPELHAVSPKPTLNGEIAYELEPTTANGFKVKKISYVRRIFFLERTLTAGCHMVACRPEYARQFFENNAERLPDELPRAKEFRSSTIQALSNCPAWLLRTGESPQGTAEAVDEFLSKRFHARA